MPFQPFATGLADARVVEIPAAIEDDLRAAFVGKISAAARQQAELSRHDDTILKITGEIRIDGDRLIIPHEPASPAILEQWLSTDERMDERTLLWMGLRLFRALDCAAEQRVLHGGILPAALYLGAGGQLKLGDFGIAPAIMAVTDPERHKYVHCAAAVEPEGHGLTRSGVWRLLSEEEPRESGWIASFFSHELQQGERPNFKTDQFAAAVVLYMLAARGHPFGVEFSDPTAIYFQIDPYDLTEERKSWAKALERHAGGLATADDKLIVAMVQTLQRAAASDPERRFATPKEAREQIRAVSPVAWDEAAGALREGEARLNDGDADGFLGRVEPWENSEDLPEIWRERLSPMVAEVRAQRDVIIRRKQLEKTLADGRRALDAIDLEKARRFGREILDAPECTESLRVAGLELLEQCAEQENFMLSGADEVAEAYLDAARDAISRDELKGGRAILTGVMKDPATPPARATQARNLAAEIELIEQRLARCEEELAEIRAALAARQYEDAVVRSEALLAEPDLRAGHAEIARSLLEEGQRRREARDRWLRALTNGSAAWDSGDEQGVAHALAEVPDGSGEPEVQERRDKLVDDLQHMRAARAQLGELVPLLERDDARGALKVAQDTLRIGALPVPLEEQIKSFVRRCEERIEQQRQERIAAAHAAVAEARQKIDAADTKAARALLVERVDRVEELPEEVLRAAAAVREVCDQIEAAQHRAQRATGDVAARRFAEALKQLAAIDLAGLPAVLVDEITALRLRTESRREAWIAEQRRQLAERIERAKAALASGRLEEAATLLDEAQRSALADEPQRAAIVAHQKSLTHLRAVAGALDKAEHALPEDPDAAEEALRALPAELPDWAQPRVAQTREHIGRVRADRHDAAVAAVCAALDEAEKALERGEDTAGREHLARIASISIEKEAGLAERCERLTKRAAEVASWNARLAALEQLRERADWPSAQRDATALAAADPPAYASERIASVRSRADAEIEQRRSELDRELKKIGERLKERGRRFRNFDRRLEEFLREPLLTSVQQERAAELRRQFDALPVPKPSRAPLYVAGGVLGLALLAAIPFILPSGPSPNPEPPPQPQPEPEPIRIDVSGRLRERLAALQEQLRAAAERAVAEGRLNPGYTLAFESDDSLPTRLFARSENGAVIDLGEVGPDQLDALSFRDSWNDRLFPAAPVPERPSVAERMEAAIARVQPEMDAVRREHAAERREPPVYMLAFDPPDALAARLVARTPAGEAILLAEVATEDALERLSFDPAWSSKLFPPLPPEAPTFAEASSSYREMLEAAVEGVEFKLGEPDGSGALRVAGRFGDRPLLAFEGLHFDPTGGVFDIPAENVAAHFSRQTAALAALHNASVQFKGASGYEDRLVPADPSSVQLVSIGANGGIAMEVALRLRDDPRSAGAFDATGWFLDGAYSIDADGRLRFGAYLRGLQEERAAAAADALRDSLELPDGLALNGPSLSEEGVLAGEILFGGLPMYSFKAEWDPSTLSFPIQAKAVRDSAAAIFAAKVASDADALHAVRESWARFVAASGGALGPIDYLRSCSVMEIHVDQSQPPGGFGAPSTITIGSPDRKDESVAVRVTFVPATGGTLGFAPPAEEVWRAAAEEFRRMAALPDFRQRRRDAALAELAASIGKPLSSLKITQAGEPLVAEIAGSAETLRFTWPWDESALRYAAPREERIAIAQPRTVPEPRVEPRPEPRSEPRVEPRPIASIDDHLAGLAQRGSVTPAELEAALLEVANRKIGRMQAPSFRLSRGASSGSDAAARLVAISRELTGFLTPNPARDPLPTHFIEFYQGDRAIYALSWKTTFAGSDDPAGVSETRVTEVMPRADLQADPREFHQRYTSDAALGERLIGRALGDGGVISASPGGAVGVVIAPDGPLWLVRWEQIPFGSRRVENLNGRGAGVPRSATSLRDLLAPEGDGESRRWRRAGLWCVPTLPGRWSGNADGAVLNLGEIIPGRRARELRFNAESNLVIAVVEGPQQWTDFPDLRKILGALRRETVGYEFWDRLWGEKGWRPTFVTSIALLPTE